MFKNFRKIKYYFKHQQQGMTLVELMVVLAIFALITGLIMFDYGSFKSATSTRNLADDIALSIRKAQSYAIGVRGTDSIFEFGHGIHFTTSEDISDPLAGSNKSFVLFTDVNKSNSYNYTGQGVCDNPVVTNECREALSINSADKISKIKRGGVIAPDGAILDIVFLRPNPDAIFCYKETASSSCISNYSNVEIEVSNGRTGDDLVTKSIKIWNTGQISTD